MSGRERGRAIGGNPLSRSASAIAGLIASLSEDPIRRRVLESDAAHAREQLSGAVLQLCLAFSLEERRTASQERPTRPEVARLLEALPRWSKRAGLSSPTLVERSAVFEPDPAGFCDALGEGAWRALLDAVLDQTERGLTSRDPGAVHQELLEIELTRLSGRSLHFPETGTWVLARDVLASPPGLRSKWLQRTAGLPKSAVQRHAAPLAQARTEDDVVLVFGPAPARGAGAATPGSLAVTRSEGRRRAGSHYTPAELRRAVVERALGPLVDGASYEEILALRVCDPAMGSGDFLAEIARFLAEKLLRAEGASGGHVEDVSGETEPPPEKSARWSVTLGSVVRDCVYGVDKDPVAVDLARWSLSRLAGALQDIPDLSQHLKWGDALIGNAAPLATPTPRDAPGTHDHSPSHSLPLRFPALVPRPPSSAFHWTVEFSEIFSPPRGGFDACIGNPPWVAYAGRAAQPLDPKVAAYYEQTNPAFHGYRTLHGLFVRRSAELLAVGGRLGLVLPTSVADLAGYGRTRDAHDALSEADIDLLDFGDGAFRAVFQPCMALTSTRRQREAVPPERSPGAPWQLARTDLDDVGFRLLERLQRLPVLDPALFGERGFQTSGSDLSHLRKLDAPDPPFVVAIREGTDLAEFQRYEARTFLDPNGLTGRLRPLEDYQRTLVLIRQTARYPIAALSDGLPFRNSILAGFSSGEWPASALAAYLNSSAVRFYHYVRHRDARQGMPQLKIGHLRALPTLSNARAREKLSTLGERLGKRNRGLTETERRELDDIVFDALEFSARERALVDRFTEERPPPKSKIRAR